MENNEDDTLGEETGRISERQQDSRNELAFSEREGRQSFDQHDEEELMERDDDGQLNERRDEQQYTARSDEDELLMAEQSDEEQLMDGNRENEIFTPKNFEKRSFDKSRMSNNSQNEEENVTDRHEERFSGRRSEGQFMQSQDEDNLTERYEEQLRNQLGEEDQFFESRDAEQGMEMQDEEEEEEEKEEEEEGDQNLNHEVEQSAFNQKEIQERHESLHQSVRDDPTLTVNQSDRHNQPNRRNSPPTFGEATDGHGATSPNTKYKDAAATVRFLLLPSQQIATVRFNLNQTLSELKQHIATEMKMNPQVIQLMFDGKKIPDESNLIDLGVLPNGTIQIQLHSIDPVNHPIQAFRPRQEYHMPDVITVRIPIDNCRSRDVVVEVLKETTKKPWLGGYRDKRHQVIYHHAAVQTMPKPRPPPTVEQFSRDTQTSEQKHITQQTTNETATQMTKIGTYVSCKHDRLIAPGQYTTADEFNTTRILKVVVIQKYYRRWLAKRRVKKIREAERVRREWEKQEEILKKKEKEARIQREYERRMNPKSKEDFDLLYHALEKWRKEEEERINSTLSGAERKAALYMLLEQETHLIASIGRHKIEADSENKNKLINDFLEKAAAPKRWKGRDGKTTEMDTPYTLRAQQLKDIYNSVNMKYITQDERLDVLLTLKHTIKEHDCKLTQEIVKLIDREADLLMRGVQENNLDGLRKRISTLFLEYIKTPLFNPEAARLLKVPQDPSSLRQNIYFCPSCTRYLPSTEFKLSSNSKTASRCRKCIKKNNDACLRQDHSHFRHMLRHVCRSEESFAVNSKIAFLMQENDIRYLVENVWDSQSVLSAMDDLYELVLIRWDQKEEWSPWNCVLLTKEEASAHAKLENVNEAYGQEFLHRVKHKHTLARNHFSRLPKMAEYLRSKRDSAASSSAAASAVPTLSGKRMMVTPAAV